MCALRFLTESVLARADIVRLREDVVKYERIAKSAGFERLESADKAAMEELPGLVGRIFFHCCAGLSQ